MSEGIEPNIREKEIQRAYQVMNRSKAGIEITQDDIDWQTMKIIEIIQSEMNRLQMEKAREIKHKMNKTKRG